MEKLKLIQPTPEYLPQVWAYRQECLDVGSSMDGCGPMKKKQTAEEWLKETELYTDPATLPEGKVLATQFITVRESDDRVVGFLQVRHYLNDFLAQFGGHIGYCVRPSERRKGYATEQLRQGLAYCKEKLGLDKVLITCLTDNEGSRRTILSQGGVYDGTVHELGEDVDLERYWISL